MAPVPDSADTPRLRTARWLTLAVVLAAAVLLAWHWRAAGGIPGSASQPTSQPLAQPRHDLPGLPNFAQVSPVLYRGAQPSPEGFRELKKMGVRTIVDLRALHGDQDKLQGTGLRYVRLHCNAWNPEEEDVIRFLKVMADPANHPVFVHCAQGADRTGCMVAVYRMVDQGWTREQAMAELANFGFHPVWTQIVAFLQQFDPQTVPQTVRDAAAPPVETVP
jgi:protein tyrosine/serine phosphatase